MESEQTAILRSIDESLSAIRKILEIQAKQSIVNELEGFASTEERRKMWLLCNGELSNDEIAKKVGSTLRAVQYFVKDGRAVGLITMAKRGFPKRAMELLPKNWKEFKMLEKTESDKEETVNE